MNKRTTSLWIKRPLLNRLAWWFYDRFCGEPYIPNGKVIVKVNRGIKKGETKEWKVAHISFIPDKFIPGIHEISVHDKLNGEVIFIQDLWK